MAKTPIRFTRSSSVVIVGAHPDDAVRACGGVMLRAMAAGGTLNVVSVTDGAALKGKDGIDKGRRMARSRKAEQVKALTRLGVPLANVFFLGFPDGGIAKLRHTHRTDRTEPYSCPWLDADRTDRKSCRPGVPFNGNALLDLLTEILAAVSPTHVFTHHGRDRHPDHRGVTWFIRRALVRFLKKGVLEDEPTVYEYLTYLRGRHWPPAGSSVPVKAARALPFSGGVVNFRLSAEAFRRKDRALDCFVPILGKAYIDNWRRTNEVVWQT